MESGKLKIKAKSFVKRSFDKNDIYPYRPLFSLARKAQREKLSKEKRRLGDFARCDERPTFRRRLTTNF
jgi:hypothetical protein